MSGDPMLDGITRWTAFESLGGLFQGMNKRPTGKYVLFSDLPALLAAVREDERVAMEGDVERALAAVSAAYAKGEQDALADFLTRVGEDDPVYLKGQQDERERSLNAEFLDAMAAWSIGTFGPGDRLDGVLDHMAKEIEEARAKPDDVSEWADLAILAFDGAQRQGITGQQFIDAYRAKFAKNRSRTWPDWRTAEPGKAIEHDRSSDD